MLIPETPFLQIPAATDRTFTEFSRGGRSARESPFLSFVTSPQRPPAIGFVGGIGSGKSSVVRWLAERCQILILDGDRIGHSVLSKTEIVRLIGETFGPDVLDDDGQVNRSALARKVFGADQDHQTCRDQREAIVHPEIRRHLEEQIREASPQLDAVILDAAVLFEAGWNDLCSAVVFVDAPEALRGQRVKSRGWTPEELSRREASQWALARKRRLADFTIDNRGELDDCGRQLVPILQQLRLSQVTESDPFSPD